MSEKIKKIICCLTACSVLVFSCVFMPRQKVEALSEVGVIGTVGGLMGIALLLYGVSVSDPAVFDSNDIMTTASKGFLSAVGLGAFTYDSPISYAAFNASSWLAAAKDLADAAYSSGACSTEIAGPLPAPGTFYQQGEFTVLNTNFVGTRTFKDPDSSCILSVTSSGTENLLYFYLFSFVHSSNLYALSPVFLDDSSFKISAVNFRGDTFSMSFQNQEYISSSGKIYYAATGPSTLYIPSCLSFPTSLLNHSKYADLCDFTYPSICVDDLLSKPVIPGACDVFNSSKSLDSYHVDSPGNDVLDIGNMLEKTGCDTVDDVLTKVRDGELTVADVQIGLGTQPYIDVDVDTGTIAIPGETVNSRPIALTPDLAIPADITIADTYVPANPPLDKPSTDLPSLPKGAYAFPLADYFPFCLPFDLYRFTHLFVATPRTPVITLDFSTFLPFLDKDDPDQYVYTFDLHCLDTLAEIVRTLELFGIILGIGLITRKIIGW